MAAVVVFGGDLDDIEGLKMGNFDLGGLREDEDMVEAVMRI